MHSIESKNRNGRYTVKKSPIVVSALSLLCALAALPASADSLYSTLPPGSFTYQSTGWSVNGDPSHLQATAMPFSLSSAANVSDAQVELTFGSGVDDTMELAIESDNGGAPSGIVVDTLQETGTITWNPGLNTFDCSGASCSLVAGSYWLVAYELDTSASIGWNFSYNQALGNVAFSTSGLSGFTVTPNDTQAAFQIDGTPSVAATPEPGSFFLLGSGMAGVALLGMRKALV
jgi:hypothetical protein